MQFQESIEAVDDGIDAVGVTAIGLEGDCGMQGWPSDAGLLGTPSAAQWPPLKAVHIRSTEQEDSWQPPPGAVPQASGASLRVARSRLPHHRPRPFRLASVRGCSSSPGNGRQVYLA